MTKISSYIVDQNISGGDKWIGSDAENYLITKNFTPNNLANYFNHNNVIDLGSSIRYMYQTLEIGELRANGTISFETEIGPQVNFSDISTFLISKITLKDNTVTEYLDFLVDSKVILSKSSDINTFGYYKITSIEPYIPDPNFFVVVVEFLDGNGFIYEDLDYLISLVDKAADAIPTSWGTIIGDITNQTDLIEYLGDEYYPLLSNPAGYLTVDTVPIPSLQDTIDVDKSADRVRLYYNQFNDGIFAPLVTYFVDVKPSLVDDRIYMYGNFTSYDGTPINRILRLNGDGTLDTGFIVGTGLNSNPFASSSLLPTSDDKLFVSGFFTSYNGVSSNRIVKLNGDGSIDTGFVTGSGFNNWTGQMALNSSGQLCIVGSATSYNGVSKNRFFRLNPDGTNDASLVIGTGFSNNFALGIKVDISDNFYITGYFTAYNGTASSGIIKLFSDGSIDTSFNIGTGILNPNENVNYTTLLSDGTVLLYGALVGFNGTTVGRIVKLNADGSINATFAANVGTGFNLAVGSTCYETPSNKIILTGGFTSFNGVTTNKSIILNLDGTIHKVFPSSNLNRSFLVQGERIIGVASSAGGYYTTEVLDTYPVNVKELTFDELTGKAEYKIGGLDSTSEEELLPKRLIREFIQIESPTPILPTKTSDLINDGEDGVHPFITLEDIPAYDTTTRYVSSFTATAGQTLFTVIQLLPVGYFDVYLNGVKIDSFISTDYTITLDDPCIVGDLIDIISYNVLSLTSRDTRRNATDSVDTNTNYCGVAPADSLETDDVWTISKIIVADDGSVVTTFAYDVAWTDREIIIYT